jgi:ribonuclease P protein component
MSPALESLRKASEKNLSAKSQKTEEGARLSQEDADKGRPQGPEAQEEQGEGQADGLAGSLMEKEVAPRVVWITRKREMLSVRREGTPSRGKYVFVWVLEGEGGNAPAAGVVTGRGFAGAVRRNRARRRLKGAVLDRRALLGCGNRYLFEARPGAEKVNYQILVIEVEKTLSKV